MREILFRGKREDNGKWIEGNYILQNDSDPKRENYMKPYIKLRNYVNIYKVFPETIGQYTGLTDKNGKRIFEGDIVNFKTIAYTFKKCVVKYDEQYARFACIDFNKVGFPMDISFVYEIIGNIHDNPELLEGTK